MTTTNIIPALIGARTRAVLRAVLRAPIRPLGIALLGAHVLVAGLVPGWPGAGAAWAQQPGLGQGGPGGAGQAGPGPARPGRAGGLFGGGPGSGPGGPGGPGGGRPASGALLEAGAEAGPQGIALDDAQQYQTFGVTPAERAEMLREARQPMPAGLSGPALRAEFMRRHALAVRSQSPMVAGDIARAWHEALPDDFNGTWNHAVGSLGQGDIQAFLRLGELAVAQARAPGTKALVASELAARQLEVLGDFARAQQTLAQAERFVAQSRNAQQDVGRFFSARGESRTAGFKASLLQELGRAAQAREAASQAVDAAQRAITLSAAMDPRQQTLAQGDLMRALLRQSAVLRASGQMYDAEQSLRRVLTLAGSQPTTFQFKTFIYQEAAALRTQQGRFVEAEQWAVRAINLAPAQRQRADVAPAASHVLSQVQRQNALAGQQRFDDVLAAMRETDERARLAPDLLALSANPLIRAWALLRTGQAAQALPIAQAHQARLTGVLGRDHTSAITARALHAWALLDAAQRDAAMAAFDEVMPLLVEPPGAGSDVEDQALLRLLRRDLAGAYLRAVSNQPDDRRVGLALRVAEWVQSSSVQQALADAAVRQAVTQPQLQEVLRREQDLRHEVEALYRYLNRQDSETDARRTPQIAQQMRERLAALQAEHRQLREQLARSFPEFDRLVRPRPPSAADIAARLKPGEAFVLLLPASDATYAFAVPAGGRPRLHRASANEAALAAWVRRARATLDVAGQGAQAPAFDRAAAVALYDALLRPLQAELAGRTHLIVAAQGTLAQIPLAVLDASGGQGAPQWLIRQAAISHVPGASAWLALQRPGAQGGADSTRARFMGWGDPTFDLRAQAAPGATRNTVVQRADTATDLEKEDPRAGLRYDQIPPLPETRDEVIAIARTLGADAQRDARFGAQATRDSVLQVSQSGDLATRRVILFATHGLVPGDLPNLSQPALAMAADGREKDNPLAPLLTLEDVLGLKLNADWVVLSACNTAAADGRAEEALSGLARGFFYAGSRSLLVTHWAVESQSAMLLTTGTFEHYTANPTAPKAESLRQAMLKVMALPQYAHPAFWAPYALVGDGGR